MATIIITVAAILFYCLCGFTVAGTMIRLKTGNIRPTQVIGIALFWVLTPLIVAIGFVLAQIGKLPAYMARKVFEKQ